MKQKPAKIGITIDQATSERRLRRELATVRCMIEMYCRAHHGRSILECDKCGPLWDYVCKRVTLCPYLADKPACVKCPVHCYKPDMREAIRQVMRYSGPRMLTRHPLLALAHFLDRLR